MKISSILLVLACASLAQSAPFEDAMKASATKAIKLMERSIGALAPNIPCASCHHNNMPLWAFSIAREHGLPIDAELNKKVAIKTYSFLKDLDRAAQGTFFVDPSLEGGQMLAFASSVGVEPSLTSTLHLRRTASLQREDGRWVTFDARPPHSSSVFMTTALNVKALNDLMPATFAQERDTRIAKARNWLATTRPASVEDSAFQLLGLMWSGASRSDLDAAAKVLLDTQRPDGAWAQVQGRTPDAYATGEALAALKMTKTASDEAYSRGAAWLLQNQLADGSWLVKTRLHEVAPISPPYMETGFPHGKDQIISMVGTTWAVMALALGLPEHRQTTAALIEVRPEVPAWAETAVSGSVDQISALDAALRTPGGSTLLMLVANDPAKVRALIAHGADVKARAKSGHTALTVAATSAGSAPILRMLIEHGADAKPIKDIEFHANPLVAATFAGDLEAVRILLDHGANATQPMLLQGMVPMNPVSAAVHLEEAAILSEYLSRGVSPDFVDEVPMLSLAAIRNRPAAAKVLIEAGADPNFKDKFGWTPIRHSRSIEHDTPEVEQLIRAASEKKEAKTASR